MRSILQARFFSSVFLLLLSGASFGADWRAGTARMEITPDPPVWLAGYAARTRPGEGTLRPLFVKALALEDGQGTRMVVVTSDLLGFPARFTDEISRSVQKSTGLPRAYLFFNASHTHSGPAVADVLSVAYDMKEADLLAVEQYTEDLGNRFTKVIEAALSRLQPVRLAFGTSEAGFATNRRVPSPEGYRIGVNRLGPVDHRVPFLVVDTLQGQPLAIMFGYSCHCTTLQGENYFYHGDYAGVAQELLEQWYAGTTALFVTGTAGDANPEPRGRIDLAEQHGLELAQAVRAKLNGPLVTVSSPLRLAYEVIELPFGQLPSVPELRERLESENRYVRRHAQLMLDHIEREQGLQAVHQYPVQVIRFGESLTLVALGGEVVVDYGSRIRTAIAGQNLWVAGYSNEVTCYIPSRRVLEEGGYEAEDSMLYYGKPSSFDTTVEERIMTAVMRLFDRLD